MKLGGEVARALRSMRCVLHPLGSRRFIRCTRSQHTWTLIFMLIFCCLLSNDKLWTEKGNSFKASVTASRAAEAAVVWGTLDDCFAACELPQQHQFGTLCEPILRKTVIQGPSQTRKDLAHFPTFT